MEYDPRLLLKAPDDYDVKKIGFILLEAGSESEQDMDIDYDLTPRSTGSPDDKQIKCHICSKSYVNRANLKRHLTTVHLTPKDFQCKICFKKFEKQAQLSGHFRVHGKSKHRPSYTCDYCGTTEKTRNSIIQHIEIHKGIMSIDVVDIFLQ